MTSILLLAIGIGIAVALLGSVAFQFQTPIDTKFIHFILIQILMNFLWMI